MAKTKEQLLNILDQFQLDEKVVSAEPFGNGHINDTLKVTNEKGEIKYVLQRINHLIFTNVDMLQNNIHVDRKSTRLNSSHTRPSRMPSSA